MIPRRSNRMIVFLACFGTCTAITGISAEECPPNAECAPPPNSYAIPNVVGMKVGKACEAMARKEFSAYVYSERQSREVGPGRIVSQKPRAGSVPGGPTGVLLVVSGPFPDLLPRSTSCANRRIGPDSTKSSTTPAP